MFTKSLIVLRNRKAVVCLSGFVTGLGMLLMLLAVAGGLREFLQPHQLAGISGRILLRLIGGMLLVAVGFAGLVLSAPETPGKFQDWSLDEPVKEEPVDLHSVECRFCDTENGEGAERCCGCGVEL